MRLWDTRTPLLDLPESVLIEMVRESHLRRGRFAARKRRRAEAARQARKAAKAESDPPDPGRFKHRWAAAAGAALPGMAETARCRNCGAEAAAGETPPERGCISPEERRARKAAGDAATGKPPKRPKRPKQPKQPKPTDKPKEATT